MITYTVIHLKLNADMRLSINGGGWACPVGKAYMDGEDGNTQAAREMGMYVPQAIVECSDLDHLFHDTNHIDRSWTENASVRHFEPRVRSTSVGDIVVDQINRIVYLCASFGWNQITGDEADAFLTISDTYNTTNA